MSLPGGQVINGKQRYPRVNPVGQLSKCQPFAIRRNAISRLSGDPVGQQTPDFTVSRNGLPPPMRAGVDCPVLPLILSKRNLIAIRRESRKALHAMQSKQWHYFDRRPGPALRPKRFALRATQGYAPGQANRTEKQGSHRSTEKSFVVPGAC